MSSDLRNKKKRTPLKSTAAGYDFLGNFFLVSKNKLKTK